jgi:hypothetical protein
LADDRYVLAAWKLPLIVGGIAVSIVLGLYLGGPGLGMAVGALAATSIVVMAVRNPPKPAIVPAESRDGRERILVVAPEPLEDEPIIERLAVAAGADHRGHDQAEVLVLAPARNRALDRWTGDVGPGRERAQQALVLTLASLARRELAAEARIGDEDLVQAVADEVRSYPATAVMLVTGASDGAGSGAAAELDSRLAVPFEHLVSAPPRHPEPCESPRSRPARTR